MKNETKKRKLHHAGKKNIKQSTKTEFSRAFYTSKNERLGNGKKKRNRIVQGIQTKGKVDENFSSEFSNRLKKIKVDS